MKGRMLCLRRSPNIIFGAAVVYVLILMMTCWNDSITDSRRLLLTTETDLYRSSSSCVPKKIHFMILGKDPPQYMLELVNFNKNYMKTLDPEFTTKLWRDDDVEKLVQGQNDPALSQAWEYVKADEGQGRYAKMADFARPLIIYIEGGVYLDADMVPCGGLSFMVDEPGVVNFPFIMPKHMEVNSAASSPPKGHSLMKMAMEYFISKGPAITSEHNLDAAGPRAMALVADKYISDLQLHREDFKGLLLPHFHLETQDMYADLPDAPGAVVKAGTHAKMTDIKYSVRPFGENVRHLQFGSWKRNTAWANGPDARKCVNEPNEVLPFLEWVCLAENRYKHFRFEDCGVINKE